MPNRVPVVVMKVPSAVLVVLSFALVGLAGCLDGDEVDTSEADRLAAAAEATEQTGSITGEVVSTALDVIADAEILLRNREDNWLTETDRLGRFTFNELKPAHYTIEAAADGFMTTRKSIVVEAGNVTNLSFMLEPLVTLKPYFETRDFIGVYECAVGAEAVAARRSDSCTFFWRTGYDTLDNLGVEPPIPRDPGNTENTFWWPVQPNVRAVFSEVQWDESATAPDHMRMVLAAGPIHAQTDRSRYVMMDVPVGNPGRAVVGFGLQDDYGDATVLNGIDDEEEFREALDWANGTLDVATRGFVDYDYQLAYSWKFHVFVTAFYDMLPRSDFTALPDA